MPSDKIDNFPTPVSDARAEPESIARIKLTANNIMIRMETAPEVSKGGIILTPSARASMTQEVKRCEVLAVGPGCYTGEACAGCKGVGYFEQDLWPGDGEPQIGLEGGPNGSSQPKREDCSLCGGSGLYRRKPYVQPGDVAYFNYVSDHGEIDLDGEKVRIVRDVVLQAVEEEWVTNVPTNQVVGDAIVTTPKVQKRIRPLEDRILVRRSKEIDTTVGGIIVPDAYKEKRVEGEVLAVGPGLVGKDQTPRPILDIKPGDVVIFGKYDGNEITVSGEKLVLLKADNAMAVIERGE